MFATTAFSILNALAYIPVFAVAAVYLLFTVSLTGFFVLKLTYKGGSSKEFSGELQHKTPPKVKLLRQRRNHASSSSPKTTINDDRRDIFAQWGASDDVALLICSYLHPRSITKLSMVNRHANKFMNVSTEGDDGDSFSNALWKSIWIRDHGKVLMDWKISRDAFRRSLVRFERQNSLCGDTCSDISSLENRIEAFFDERQNFRQQSAREFYFKFQETYLNYVLAGHNTSTSCLLGIHGHIFDFTNFAEYHPGLAEPILVECGRDATYFFENIPHSKAARIISRKLCLLVDRSTSQSIHDDSDISEGIDQAELSSCGLYRLPPSDWSPSGSNTRPPRYNDPHDMQLGLDRILPMKTTRQPTRRAPTLHRIRESCRVEEERAALSVATVQGARRHRPRVCYDPFLNQWIGWYSDQESNVIFFDVGGNEGSLQRT